MISSDNRRYAYGRSQLIEVICQLRFPTILSIDTREPADFQETVRAAFPRYQCQVEKLPGVNGAPARTVNNHTFISEDGGYKLSLTKDFIALSTMRYTHWEDFAARLDEPLGQFIKIYRPNCFDRVGLRFVNAISREQLGLTGRRWNDLLQPPYLAFSTRTTWTRQASPSARSTSSASSMRSRPSSCTRAQALSSATSAAAIRFSRYKKRKCASSSIRTCTPLAR